MASDTANVNVILVELITLVRQPGGHVVKRVLAFVSLEILMAIHLYVGLWCLVTPTFRMKMKCLHIHKKRLKNYESRWTG